MIFQRTFRTKCVVLLDIIRMDYNYKLLLCACYQSFQKMIGGGKISQVEALKTEINIIMCLLPIITDLEKKVRIAATTQAA